MSHQSQLEEEEEEDELEVDRLLLRGDGDRLGGGLSVEVCKEIDIIMKRIIY